MKKKDAKYSNGQMISDQKGDILTYYLKDGRIKAQGKFIDGKMEGKWIFNKKEGYLWQVGYFENGSQHGLWTRYNPDGSVQKETLFERGKSVKK